MNEEKRIDDFFTYIRLASKCVFKLKNRAVKNKDLKTIHVEILFYLSYKGPLTATEIVKLTIEDKAAVSKPLKVLKEREYINYDNKNKYKEKISLTVSGEILARNIQEVCSKPEEESLMRTQLCLLQLSRRSAITFRNTLTKTNTMNLKSRALFIALCLFLIRPVRI